MDKNRQQTALAAPVADRRPHETVHHGISRVDDYAWLRVDNWQEVMQNPKSLDHRRARLSGGGKRLHRRVMAPTEALQAGSVRRNEGPDQGRRRKRARSRWSFFIFHQLCDRRATSAVLSHPARRRRQASVAGWQRPGRRPRLLRPGRLRSKPGPQACRLRFRRQGLGIQNRAECATSLREPICPTKSPTPSATWSGPPTDSSCSTPGWTTTTGRSRCSAIAWGPPSEEDALVYEERDTGYYVSVSETQSRRYIVIRTGDHQTTEIHLDQLPEQPETRAQDDHSRAWRATNTT